MTSSTAPSRKGRRPGPGGVVPVGSREPDGGSREVPPLQSEGGEPPPSLAALGTPPEGREHHHPARGSRSHSTVTRARWSTEADAPERYRSREKVASGTRSPSTPARSPPDAMASAAAVCTTRYASSRSIPDRIRASRPAGRNTAPPAGSGLARLAWRATI